MVNDSSLKDFIKSENYNDYNFFCDLKFISLDMDNYFRHKKAYVDEISMNKEFIKNSTGKILIIGKDHTLSREALFVLEKNIQ